MNQKSFYLQQEEDLCSFQPNSGVPCSPVSYSCRREADRGIERFNGIVHDHILGEDDELVLVDHLARCSSAIGGAGVTGVVLEECGDLPRKLKIRVATGDSHVYIAIDFLRKFLKLASQYASSLVRETPMEKKSVLKGLIEKVIHYNRNRILFRIGSDLVESPWGDGQQHSRASMFQTLSGFMQDMDPASRATERLREFLKVLKKVESMGSGIMFEANLHALKSVVRNAYELCYPEGVRCPLEKQLRSAGVDLSLLDKYKTTVLQVEKIAQYIEACKYLLRLVDIHPRLFSRDIEVFACPKPKVQAAAANFHAELLLIAYYEAELPERPPRAIGCSKWACSYCHIVIQCQGKYRISGAHNRLYPFWELPVTDTNGVIVPSLMRLRDLAGRKLAKLTRRDGKRRKRPFPVESRPSSQIG
jgi:hypothetical protein